MRPSAIVKTIRAEKRVGQHLIWRHRSSAKFNEVLRAAYIASAQHLVAGRPRPDDFALVRLAMAAVRFAHARDIELSGEDEDEEGCGCGCDVCSISALR